jgi:hypothetical protein
MPNSSSNLPLKVRMVPADKAELMSTADAWGSNASDVVQAMIDVWLAKPGARMPPGPWLDATRQALEPAGQG